MAWQGLRAAADANVTPGPSTTVALCSRCPVPAGPDSSDGTASQRPAEDFTAGLLPAEALSSKPLAGRHLAVIQETTGEGVDAGKAGQLQMCQGGLRCLAGCQPALPGATQQSNQVAVPGTSLVEPMARPFSAGVAGALASAVSHLQSLGAEVEQASLG